MEEAGPTTPRPGTAVPSDQARDPPLQDEAAAVPSDQVAARGPPLVEKETTAAPTIATTTSPSFRATPLAAATGAAACVPAMRSPLMCAVIGLCAATLLAAVPAVPPPCLNLVHPDICAAMVATGQCVLSPERGRAECPLSCGLCAGQQSTASCSKGTTLTLIVPEHQWASVDECFMCPPEIAKQNVQFLWKPRCDVASAAASLNALVAKCGGCTTRGYPLRDCTVSGWCQWQVPPTQPECVVPDRVVQTCMHYDVLRPFLERKDRDPAPFTREALEMVDQWFGCKAPGPMMGRPFTTTAQPRGELANATWRSATAATEHSWARECTREAVSRSDPYDAELTQAWPMARSPATHPWKIGVAVASAIVL